jgi:sugar/nucleoside kinase (ribokinase family)
MEKRFDAVGIGNAIVDVLAEVDEKFLSSMSLDKGSMRLIDEEYARRLHESINALEHVSGGSAANTIAGMAMLGDSVAFIGKVKGDELGHIFEEGLSCIGVECRPKKADSGLPTARCIVLVTPDSQRTMCTYLGTSASLTPEDIDEDILRDSRMLYFEGYLWDRTEAKEAINKALEITKGFEGKVAFSLSDSFCVERHREEFFEIIERHADIVFANEAEIESLFGSSDIRKSLKRVSSQKTVFAVTLAEKGSVVIRGDEKIEVSPFLVKEPLDSTGAGDMYAAGFLHGFLKGKDLKECGRMASIVSSEVIKHYGARFKGHLIESIRKKIDI